MKRTRRSRLRRIVVWTAGVVLLWLVVLVPATAIWRVLNPNLSALTPAQLERYLASNDMQRSHEAARELARRDPDVIARMARHLNRNVRHAATRATRWTTVDAAEPILTQQLKDPDTHVRLEAVYAIRYSCGDELRRLLAERRPRERSPLVLSALDEALRELDDH